MFVTNLAKPLATSVDAVQQNNHFN